VTVDEINRAIEQLQRNDRAFLRPWIFARSDVRGYPLGDPNRRPDDDLSDSRRDDNRKEAP
jgi:hypothetical protein